MKRMFYKLFEALVFCCLALSCHHYEREIATGNMIVSMIERYLQENDSLPDSLRDLGQEELVDGVKYYYDRIDSTRYFVWFGTDYGFDVIFYDSRIKQWKRGD